MDIDEMDIILRQKFKELRSENDAFSKEFSQVMEYQNKGMNLEKAGFLEDAAKSFEQAIAYGENSSRLRINNYQYSIKRLAVVYRKLKRYDEEVRVIRISLAHEDMDQKSYKELESRLEKVLSLKQK